MGQLQHFNLQGHVAVAIYNRQCETNPLRAKMPNIWGSKCEDDTEHWSKKVTDYPQKVYPMLLIAFLLIGGNSTNVSRMYFHLPCRRKSPLNLFQKLTQWNLSKICQPTEVR